MILIAGIASESPVALAIEAAEECGVPHLVFDQRAAGSADIRLSFDSGAGWGGELSWDGGRADLARLTGIYVRLLEDSFLPGLAALPEDAPERVRMRDLHALLYAWFDVSPSRVANRPRAMMSNMSKTYQAILIRAAGFKVPESLVTNDPGQVLAFLAHCAEAGDEVIYKSASGTRSMVQTFREQDRERLGRIRWCPTHFQRRVRGTDVRVHVVGRRTFATSIESAATDYRYALQQSGEDAELREASLPPSVELACVRLAERLELPFTGIDLRLTPEGDYYCFEANPCPAFSYYQGRTGAPIGQALVRWLAGED